MSFETSAILLTWIAISLLALAFAGLLRQVRILTTLLRRHPLVVGPLVGERLPLQSGAHPEVNETDSLLFFADSSCMSCVRLFPVLETLAAEHAEISFLVLFKESANGYSFSNVGRIERQASLFNQLDVSVTPFGIALRNGTIAHAAPIGNESSLKAMVKSFQRKD